MKTLLTILCCFFSFALFAQWEKLLGPEGASPNCLKRVGNEIWLGTNGGLYISQNEGQSWQKSTLLNSPCIDVLSQGDTLVVIYALPYRNFDITEYNGYALVSFNAGSTWQAPALIGEAFVGGNWESLWKVKSCLLIRIGFGYKLSGDWGLTWTDANPINTRSYQPIQVDQDKIIVNTPGNTNYYNFYYSSNAGINWQLIDSTHNIFEVFAKDNILTAISASGDTVSNYHLLRSTNWGQNWDTIFNAPVNIGLGGISATDDTLFVAQGSSFLASLDNGLTWQQNDPPHSRNNLYKQIDVVNGNKLGGRGGSVGIYVPFQNTFYPTNTGLIAQNANILIANRSTLFVATYAGLFRSTDDGLTWINCQVASSDYITDIATKGDTIVAVGGTHLYKSWDNGVLWQTDSMPVYADEVELIENRIYIGNYRYRYSDDWGATWNTYPDINTAVLNACNETYVSGISMKAYGQYLFLLSRGGTLAKYEPSTQNWSLVSCFANVTQDDRLSVCGNDLLRFGSRELMVSHDGGLTWQSDSLNGLPRVSNGPPVIPKAIQLLNGAWVSTCGFYGPYISTTAGNTWRPYFTGTAPFVAIGLTAINNNLFATGYYDGIWKKSDTLAGITGIVYIDENNNGMRDLGEPPLPRNLIETVPGSYFSVSDTGGRYTMITDVIGDTLKAVLPNKWTSSKPVYYIVQGDTINQNFGINFQPGIPDLSIDISNITVFRPGFPCGIVVTATNNGTLTQSANITLSLDNNLQFVSASPQPASVNGNQYTWVTGSLNLFEKQNILINVETNVNATLGDSITCSSTVSPIINDSFPSDNTSSLKATIVGSYDPNDKNCTQGGFVTPEQLQSGEEIIFTIRFQNTGNYLADFVRIADTLSQFFDLSTFRVLGQSHAMHWAMTERGIINFYFDSILLPPSSQDEPGSHGFVKYSVRCKPNTKLGNALVNTAYIYFDFNTAIITNTTTTLVAYPFNTEVPTGISVYNNEKVNVYPNPANGMLMVDTKDVSGNGQNVAVFDLSGRVVYQQTIVKGLNTIDVSMLNTGMYMGRLSNEQDKTIGNFKFVVSR